ncbi:MAG: ATP-grasp domain-containing protein [Clostridia bacterium]|nr:ATP-grasp domain-containing protein [Clostridia bacterium]
MIKGLLLYGEADAAKNKWFIEHLTELSKNYGINLTFAVLDDTNFESTAAVKDIDFCINRTRNSRINEAFESKNIRCFNNLHTVKTANDKWLTYSLCKKLNIPVMDTVEINDASAISLEYPFIIKSRNGHGGSEVFRVNTKQDLLGLKLENKSGYIAQKIASCLGADVRVYVLGDKPIMAVKRTSSVDFRSNFSLGGKVELFTPADEQLSVIKQLRSEIFSDYAGFDFILHNGNWVLNEIEDVVGARMLYSLSDFDIAEAFIKYIYEDLSK